MLTCVRCKKTMIIPFKIISTCPDNITKYGLENVLCGNCWNELYREYEYLRKHPPPRPEIKCPFCGQIFSPVTKKLDKTGEYLAKGAVFLPWAIVSAVKNKPFVQCPHCQMKIQQ